MPRSTSKCVQATAFLSFRTRDTYPRGSPLGDCAGPPESVCRAAACPPLFGLELDHNLGLHDFGFLFRLSGLGLSDLGLCLRLCGLGLGELGVSLLLSYLGLSDFALFLRPSGLELVLVFLASSFHTLCFDALAVRYLLFDRCLSLSCEFLYGIAGPTWGISAWGAKRVHVRAPPDLN